MKSICALCMFLSLSGFGQNSVKPVLLKITNGKTTTLIFPFAIKQVDRGISILLVQKSPGLENVLLVKAARPNFPETNLTVFTSDGKFYPFLVQYAADPENLNYSFGDSLQGSVPNDGRLKQDAETALQQSHFLHRAVRDYRMVLRLNGIYLKDQILWFCLRILNKSVIDYSSAGWHCFIRNKNQAKRTAVQEIAKDPVYISLLNTVPGSGSQDFVIGFSVFTLAASQELVIQCADDSGERVLSFKAISKILFRARKID